MSFVNCHHDLGFKKVNHSAIEFFSPSLNGKYTQRNEVIIRLPHPKAIIQFGCVNNNFSIMRMSPKYDE